MKIRPVGAELFLADRRTDRETDEKKKVIFAIRNFAAHFPYKLAKSNNKTIKARRMFSFFLGRGWKLNEGRRSRKNTAGR